MAISFGNTPSADQPSHEDLIAALNRAVGESTEPGKKTKSKTKSKAKLWANALSFAQFMSRVALGVAILGAAFWAVGYVLAWQNILPFVPEWWHGVAFSAALWLFQVITPPTITLKLR